MASHAPFKSCQAGLLLNYCFAARAAVCSVPRAAREVLEHHALQVGMDLEQLTIAHTREAFDPNMILEPILQHPLQLQSAYMEVSGVEPDFTSSHNRFHGTVDYIWYTPEVSCKLVHVKTCDWDD